MGKTFREAVEMTITGNFPGLEKLVGTSSDHRVEGAVDPAPAVAARIFQCG